MNGRCTRLIAFRGKDKDNYRPVVAIRSATLLILSCFCSLVACSPYAKMLPSLSSNYASSGRIANVGSLTLAIDLTLARLADMSEEALSSQYFSLQCFSLADRRATLEQLKVILSSLKRTDSTQVSNNILSSNVLSNNIDGQLLAELLKHKFSFYKFPGAAKESTLVTGYYEPVLRGSRSRSDRYQFPLYRKPADEWLDLSRRDIDQAQALAGQGLEFVWLESNVERFFLHVQGSGIVVLPSGEFVRVGFAGKNRATYTALGKVLRERGYLAAQNVSMQSIKKFLLENEDLVDELLAVNDSYIFFEERDVGATGSFGVPLVPWRSLAVDPQYVPYGVLALVRVAPEIEEPLLMISLDTGSAIRGASHVDVFTGTGEAAGNVAGRMQQRGELLLVRGATECR